MKKIVRVNIPQNAAKLIVLALNILAKHLADGASSILTLLNMAGATKQNGYCQHPAYHS